MENAKIFKYNSDNLLVKIAPGFLNSPLYFIYEIDYGKDKKPIQVTESMFLDGKITVNIIKIEWVDDGFALIYDDENKDKILLNTQNQIKEIDDKINFIWYKSDSLIVKETGSKHFEKYKFNKYNHPLSGINISIIQAAKLNMCEWKEWQNKYCVSEWIKSDDCSGKFFYTVNEQNYPIVMRKRIKSCFGTNYGTLYFEYESY